MGFAEGLGILFLPQVVFVVSLMIRTLAHSHLFHGNPHMSGCQNYGPFLGPYYNMAPNM